VCPRVGVVEVTFAVTGCVQAPSPPSAPRYQMHVVGEAMNALVYRLDTMTGEIQTFAMMSPKFIERYPNAAKLYKEYFDTMERTRAKSGTEI